MKIELVKVVEKGQQQFWVKVDDKWEDVKFDLKQAEEVYERIKNSEQRTEEVLKSEIV